MSATLEVNDRVEFTPYAHQQFDRTRKGKTGIITRIERPFVYVRRDNISRVQRWHERFWQRRGGEK